MNLKALIECLSTYEPDTVAPIGISNPQLQRCAYPYITFDVVENTTVGDMLKSAQSIDTDPEYSCYLLYDRCVIENIGVYMLKLMVGDTTLALDIKDGWG